MNAVCLESMRLCSIKRRLSWWSTHLVGSISSMLDELFVSKAVENYFFFNRSILQVGDPAADATIDFGSESWNYVWTLHDECFQRDVPEASFIRVTALAPISKMCAALVSKVHIVGWKEPELKQGMTHKVMSKEELIAMQRILQLLPGERLHQHDRCIPHQMDFQVACPTRCRSWC